MVESRLCDTIKKDIRMHHFFQKIMKKINSFEKLKNTFGQ